MEVLQKAEDELRALLGCTVGDANDLEGEDPEDISWSILGDRKKMGEVAEELRVVIKRQITENKKGKGGDSIFMARLAAMRTTLLFYTSEVEKLSWTEASELAAKAGGYAPSYGRNIRRWIRVYASSNCLLEALPSTQYGLSDTNNLHDEDVCARLRLHLQAVAAKTGFFGAQDVVDFFASPEVQLYMGTAWRSVSLSTAARLLKYLRYEHGKAKTGMYLDGHERQDVVEYRVGFLERMEMYTTRMVEYKKDGEVATPLSLKPGEKRLILLTHDESTFYAHDQRKVMWRAQDATPIPHAKGQGQSIMVSDFLSPDFGRLKDDQGYVIIVQYVVSFLTNQQGSSHSIQSWCQS